MSDTRDTGIPSGIWARSLMSDDDMAASADMEQFIAAVQREDDAIVESEGIFHVNRRYFADHEDATKVRMLVAENRVREAARRRAVA